MPVLFALLVVLGVCGDAGAQVQGPLTTARYAAELKFRTITTGRFDVHFHQGEERLASRLVRIIEEVAPQVDRRYGAPRGRVSIVLVDQTDVSNGWATVIPYNLIELAAVPPSGESQIGNTDDWLRLVFTHEYAHVVHLENSRGWLGSLRRVFGRVPLFYSNLFLPDWQIEGLATYEESALTDRGRVRAGDFRMILERAAAEDRFAPLDRASSAVIDWPGGTSAYLYGAFFHEYLAKTYGEESLARLADETAGRLPFTGSRAFKKVYGKSLGTLWREFEASTSRTAEDQPQARRRLTQHGFSVFAPTFGPDGRLLYSVANPHGFPALLEWREGEPARHVASRYYGNRTATAGSVVVYDQLEVAGQVALQSDLWMLDTASGRSRRLTAGARAADPDISPDGRTIVCTIQESGRRIVAMLPFDGRAAAVPRTLVSEADTEFASPRWSPDGRTIVAERRRVGAPAELVLIDAATGAARPLFTAGRGRPVTPAWSRDGESVLFAWDRDGAAFTVYSVNVSTGAVRQLAGAGEGAQSPTPSPDGQRLIFVGYSADGYDLYSLPLSTAEWIDVPLPAAAGAGERRRHEQREGDAGEMASSRYSPLSTLTPRFWIPYFERDGEDTVVGAGTGGFDALGRHAYAVTAGFAVPRGRADVQAEYSYTRWWPALFAGVSDDTDTWRTGYVRSRDAGAGLLLPFRRVRWSANVLGAVSYSSDDFSLEPDGPVSFTRERSAVRSGFTLSNARGYGYSISAEHGAALSIVGEWAAGADGGSARSVVAEARGYIPVFPRHGVLAVRAASAVSRGDERVRRDFFPDGNGPQGAPFDLGLDAIGLLRGFDDGEIFGRSAAVLNADYRIPLAWPQRGVGTWPVFLRTVHAAVFFDAAHAWDARFDLSDVRRSAGAELSFDIVLGGALPLTLSTGAAWRMDPLRNRDGAVLFARVGRAF